MIAAGIMNRDDSSAVHTDCHAPVARSEQQGEIPSEGGSQSADTIARCDGCPRADATTESTIGARAHSCQRQNGSSSTESVAIDAIDSSGSATTAPAPQGTEIIESGTTLGESTGAGFSSNADEIIENGSPARQNLEESSDCSSTDSTTDVTKSSDSTSSITSDSSSEIIQVEVPHKFTTNPPASTDADSLSGSTSSHGDDWASSSSSDEKEHDKNPECRYCTGDFSKRGRCHSCYLQVELSMRCTLADWYYGEDFDQDQHCGLCHRSFADDGCRYGNNPWPLPLPDGHKVCDSCNCSAVITARLLFRDYMMFDSPPTDLNKHLQIIMDAYEDADVDWAKDWKFTEYSDTGSSGYTSDDDDDTDSSGHTSDDDDDSSGTEQPPSDDDTTSSDDDDDSSGSSGSDDEGRVGFFGIPGLRGEWRRDEAVAMLKRYIGTLTVKEAMGTGFTSSDDSSGTEQPPSDNEEETMDDE